MLIIKCQKHAFSFYLEHVKIIAPIKDYKNFSFFDKTWKNPLKNNSTFEENIKT